jgi:hypothetical protein
VEWGCPVASDVFSTALAMNNRRRVVGVSGDANFNTRRALAAGVPVDLNSLILSNSELYLLLACSIHARDRSSGWRSIAPDSSTAKS